VEITLTEIDGHPVLEVSYDPTRLSWEEAISAGCAACGVDPSQVTVTARPEAGV